MLRIFLICIIALALMMGLAFLMQKDAGYILLSYDQASIESSLWAGLAALVLISLTAYFAIKLIFKLLYSGRHIKHRMDLRKIERNQQVTAQGLTHFIEGDMQRSLRTFSRSTKKEGAALTNYIVAAQAADAIGDNEQSVALLKKAAQVPGAKTAVAIVAARLHFQNGRLDDAKKSILELIEKQPNNKAGLALLARVYERLEDWMALCDLFPKMQQQKVMSLADLEALKVKTFAASLKSATSAKVLSTHWDSLPKAMKRDNALVEAYAQGLAGVGDEIEAETVLRQVLRKDFDESLIERYGLVRGADPKKQLAVAERHLNVHGTNSALLLCLGRLNQLNENLDQAKDYFSQSLSARASAAAHAALGTVLAQQGEHAESSAHFQQSLKSDDVLALPSPASEETDKAE